jgi:hypothetical protein
MTGIKNTDPDHITVNEMLSMFNDEVTNVTKGAELRLRDFSTLLKEYVAGNISPEQATDRMVRHQEKWGDAVPGVYSVEGKSDEELLAAVETHAGSFRTSAEIETKYQDAVGRPSGQWRSRRS